jgi:hypothetical protein
MSVVKVASQSGLKCPIRAAGEGKSKKKTLTLPMVLPRELKIVTEPN